MEHKIDWSSAEYRRGEVTVRVEPAAPLEWELLFKRLVYSATWPFGEIEIANSVVRVDQVRERGVEWLRDHLNAAVEATDRAFDVPEQAGSAPEAQRRFAPAEAGDPDGKDRQLTQRLRQFAAQR